MWTTRPYTPAVQRKMGILELGELGRVSAKRLADNSFQVLGWSRSPKQIPEVISYHSGDGMKNMLAQTQIVVCLLPLTAQTRDILNAERLAHLPKGAAVINFARGPILNNADLLNALSRGHLNHAVLDVFDHEPLEADSELRNHTEITLLPHISARTTVKTATDVVPAHINHYRQTGHHPAALDVKRGY